MKNLTLFGRELTLIKGKKCDQTGTGLVYLITNISDIINVEDVNRDVRTGRKCT